MRHFVGLVLGIILAPLLLYALGWGAAVAAASWSQGSGAVTMEGLAAAGALAVAGIVVAMLTRAFPPLGAFIVGAAFVALNALNLMYHSIVEMLLQPWGPARLDWTGANVLLQADIIGMIGVALLFSALAPRRWRREPQPPAEDDHDYMSYIADEPEPRWPSDHMGGHVRTPGDVTAPGAGFPGSSGLRP